MGFLLAALVVAVTCPPLPNTELPSAVFDAVVVEECGAIILTFSALTRLDGTGKVQRSVSGKFGGRRLTLDAARDRLYVTTSMMGDEAIEVVIEARRASTLEVLQEGWGVAGEVRFKAQRKAVKPHHGTGGGAVVRLRPEGQLVVVTRADSVEVPTSIVSSWSVSLEGKVTGPQPLGEIEGSSVSGELLFALASDGRGFVAASHSGVGPRHEGKGSQLFGMTRDGRLDTSFGDSGRAVEPMIIYPMGAFSTSAGWVFAGGHSSSYRPVVVRYKDDGRLDPTYGVRGRVVIKPAEGALEHVRAVAQEGGGAQLAGIRFWRKEGRMRPTLITLDADGQAADVRELDLVDAPQVDVVRLFLVPGRGLRLAGFSGSSPSDAKARGYWRELSAPRLPAAALAPLVLTEPTPPTTLYRWVEPSGAEGFASSLEEVPAKYRAAAKPWSPD